eukprot:s459_g16.t1
MRWLLFLVEVIILGNHYTCTPSARKESTSEGTIELVSSQNWNSSLGFTAALEAASNIGSSSQQGHQVFAQDQIRNVQSKHPLEVYLLQKAQQSCCTALWFVRTSLEPVLRRAVRPRPEEPEEYQGASSTNLCPLGWSRRRMGTWIWNTEELFRKEEYASWEKGRYSEECEKTGLQGDRPCFTIPTHWGQSSTMAICRHFVCSPNIDLSIWATCTIASAYDTATTTHCAGEHSFGFGDQGGISRHEQSPGQHQGRSRESRSPKHQQDCSGPPEKFTEGEKSQREAQRATGIADSTQRIMATSLAGGAGMLGRTGAVLYNPAEQLQGDDGKDQSRTTCCEKGHTEVESPCSRDSCCRYYINCGFDRAGADRHRRLRHHCLDGKDAINSVQVLPAISETSRSSQSSSQCSLGRGGIRCRNGSTCQQKAEIYGCRKRCSSTTSWIWWTTIFVNFGDGNLGPSWSNYRAPFDYASTCSILSDAYARQSDECAAWEDDLWSATSPIWHSMSSKRRGDEFVDVFHALQDATDLRSQVLIDGVRERNALTSPSLSTESTMPTILKKSYISRNPLICALFGEQVRHTHLACGKRNLCQSSGKCSRASFDSKVQLHLWDIETDADHTIEVAEFELPALLEHTFETFEASTFRAEVHCHPNELSDSSSMGTLRTPTMGQNDQPLGFTELNLPFEAPQFLHHLQAFFRRGGRRLLHDQCLRLRSWYLHHQDVPRWYRSRVLELEGDVTLWNRDIEDVWRDQLRADLPFSIHLVQPEVQQWDHERQDAVHADIIIAQGDEDQRAGLVAIFPGRGRQHQLLATSLPQTLLGIDVIESSNFAFLMNEGTCHVLHGWDPIPLLFGQLYHCEQGDSFNVHVVPHADEQDEEQDDLNSLMATVHQIPHPDAQPLTIDPDIVQIDSDQEDLQPDDISTDNDAHESDFTIRTEDEELPWHAVAVFDTAAHLERGRVPFTPYEAFVRRVRALLGIHHHDLARILQITPTPDDLKQVSTTPLLLLRTDDFYEGDFRRAALGSTYDTIVETERFVAKLPNLIHRDRLLAWVRVDRYCSSEKDRCLVWHRGALVPKQATNLMQIEHGDYIRIAVPPFQHAEVPTKLATQCIQAGLTKRQTLQRYRQRGDDTDSLYSHVSGAQHTEDHSMMQLSNPQQQIPSLMLHSTSATNPPSLEQQCHFVAPDRPHDQDNGLRPSWHSLLQEAFTQSAWVEHEDEGPVGYIDTWHLNRFHPYVTEYCRTFRATQDPHWWYADLIELWQDQIDRSKPVYIYWVQPTPIATIDRERLGHLLLTQDRYEHLTPALITIEFQDEHHLFRFCQAGALLPNPVSTLDVRDLTRLARICITRRCTLHHGRILWGPTETRYIPAGAGLTLSVHPMIRHVHLGDEHIFQPQFTQAIPDEPADDIPVPPPLAAESHFVRQLHDIWNQHATFAPAHLERLLRVETWFLEGRDYRLHDEHRNVVLADDYWTWEEALIRRWRDLVLQDIDVDFTIVTPTPPTANHPNEVHIIVHQRIFEFDHPSIVTVVDNGILNGEPYTTAVILPSAITRQHILRFIGKEQLCPPFMLDSICHCWHRDIEVDHRPFPNRHGYAFDLHIQRQLHPGIWFDEEGDAEATSSTSLLQIGMHRSTSPCPSQDILEWDTSEGERLTGGQVAHTHRPPSNVEIPTQKIDFHATIQEFEIFDQHFFLPDLDLPSLHSAHPAYPWTTTWWDFATPGQTIWIYYDGSARIRSEAQSIAAAAAAFIQIQSQWFFAGAIAAPLPSAKNSYDAEHFASAISLKFGYDLLKIHEGMGVTIPDLHFCFDSLTVGNQTAGMWNCFCHPALGTALRNIHRVLETRFQAVIWHWHVRGHVGHPGNELVDFLANEAHGSEPTSTTRWLETISSARFRQASDWFWILFEPHYLPYWKGHQLHFLMPSTTPTAEQLGMPLDATPASAVSDSPRVKLQLRLATCNVLSLCGKADDIECGITGPSRQAMMLAQLNEEHIVIFGLQETRLRRLHHAHSDEYYLFKSAATDKGHFGIIAGFSKQLPYAYCDATQTSYKFKEQDFSIVHQDPRILIIRVSAQALKCLVIVCHAPHSGQDLAEIELWWAKLHDLIPQNYITWPLVLLTDANATVGHTVDDAIGDHQAGQHDAKSDPFEAFVRRTDTWLPSTFASSHQGPGDTWVHSGGRMKRIDYIALPKSWAPISCSSWISTTIDPSITRTDHQAPCVELHCDGELYPSKPKLTAKRRLTSGKQLDLTRLVEAEEIDPNVDVHTHAARLQQILLSAIKPQAEDDHVMPKKQTMSAATWALVLQKRAARKHLFQLNERQRLDHLDCIFTVWRSRTPLSNVSLAQYDRLFSMQDQLIANALAEFRALDRQVTSALRQDDVHFFQDLLKEGSEFLAPQQVRQFWAIIRRTLPKFRQRKMHVPPARLEVLEHQMLPHLCQLEMGEQISPADLVHQCHQRQLCVMRALPDAPILPHHLPTLTQFETALRTTTSHKATGIDPIPSCVHHDQAPTIASLYYDLILKMHLWCTEPIQFKGGVMCLIPKKGDLTQARNYRGILLLATVAKRAHSMMRAALMNTLNPKRAEGQLGGFSHQMVQFGFHAVALWTHCLAQKGLSTGVLYLDLTSAFHHLVREHVLGVANEDDFGAILQGLHEAGHPAEARYYGQQLIGTLQSMGCDSRLLQLLRDVHTDTWFTLTTAELVRTRRGTRPSSPLADAVFHAAMAHIMSQLRLWMQSQDDFTALLARHDLPMLTVIWADDVAVPWATETSLALVPAIKTLIHEVDAQFHKYGFTINYELNKTNCVVSFQGQHAPELRREFLLVDRPGCDCTFDNGRSVWLHMKPTYKHLGFTFASSHSLDIELRQRIGQAFQAMSTLGRAILRNRHFPTALRLRMFNVLVATKLFFGLGTWSTPTLRQLRQLRTAHIKMLAQVLRLPGDHRYTNAQVLAQANTADVRVLLALDRLRYARKVFTVGPEFLQQLAHREHACTQDSWLHGLAADLRWLNALIPNCVPFGGLDDFTQVIEFWQDYNTPWKRILKRALRLSIKQETMMTELHRLNHTFFRVLRESGADFDPDLATAQDTERVELMSCPCGRQFTTPQGLALHRVRAHGQFAPEHRFINGASCPHCLRFFWTSARLQQHLAYMPRNGAPNPCYQALLEQNYITEYEAAVVPRALQGALRLDSLQAAGPLPQRVHAGQVEAQRVQQEINSIEAELQVTVVPDNHIDAGDQLGQRLTRCTRLWIERFRGGREVPSDATDIGDWWLRLLLTFDPAFDAWTELVFLSWGEHILPDLLAEALDGEIEFTIENTYIDVQQTLPSTEARQRLVWLRQRLRYLQEGIEADPQPHRPVRTGTANSRERQATSQKVPSTYQSQTEWLAMLRAVRRRRADDVHCHFDAWARSRNVGITILSMDTANSVHYGNLSCHAASWQELLRCYSQGLVTATVAGSPCETFSEARHHHPDPALDSDDRARARLPRPFRSFEQLLGLPGLTMRETDQLHAGSAFFLQTTILIAFQLVTGGYFVSEHPAPPQDATRASIWTSPWLELLKAHPEIQFVVVPQWRFGATVPKPTGLLSLRMPYFVRSLFKCADNTLSRPQNVAIGRHHDGSFKTSAHKEYPAQFAAGLVLGITEQLDRDIRTGRVCSAAKEVPSDLQKWVEEAAMACSAIRDTAGWLPDFQNV